MKFAYIMRGVSGSGKSTVARRIAGPGLENGTATIHSTDDFFVDAATGEYGFDGSKLKHFHDLNFQQFCQSVDHGTEIVICDNTNMRKWEYARYLEYAESKGYQVIIVFIVHPKSADEAASRCIHKVPARVIQRMMDDWEF